MRQKTRQIGAITLALLAILAVAAGGVTAADTFDTETTVSTTQSDVSGTTTTVDLRPGNSSEALYVEINGSTTNAAGNRTLRLRPEDSDGNVIEYTAYENTSGGDAVAGTLRNVKWNITHDGFADLPRDVDGATYRLEILNQSNNNKETLNTTVVFTHKGENRTAVIAVADTSSALTNTVADRLELTETFGFFGAEKFWKDNGTDVSTWSGYTTVNGSNTSVEIHLENTTTADAYEAAAEDVDDGDWITSTTMWANGVPLLTFKNEAPDELADDAPHAIYHADRDVIEVVVAGDELKDTRTLQIRAVGGEGYGFRTTWDEFGLTTALTGELPDRVK